VEKKCRSRLTLGKGIEAEGTISKTLGKKDFLPVKMAPKGGRTSGVLSGGKVGENQSSEHHSRFQIKG